MNDPVTGVAAFDSFGYTAYRTGEYALRRSREGPIITYRGDADKLSVLLPSGPSYIFDDAAPDGRPFDGLTTHRFDSGDKSFEFETEVPEVGGVELSYLRVGFVRDELTPIVDSPILEVLVFGLVTQANDMPRVGSASYATAAQGNISVLTDWRYRFEGDVQFSANFLLGTVSTAIEAEGTQFTDPTKTIDLGTWSGTGSILANTGRFNGPLSGDDGASGEFVGALFGPEAAEMGMSFYVTQGDYTGVGVVTGLKHSPP